MIQSLIKSPFSEGAAVLTKRDNTLNFRKDSFDVVEHFYVCQDTGEEFTTLALTGINLDQVYNQYREKYGLPFPGQIRRIREKYKVSASTMSKILSLETNTYRLYEQGEVPSVSTGRWIMAADYPPAFHRLVLMSQGLLKPKEFDKISKTAEGLLG